MATASSSMDTTISFHGSLYPTLAPAAWITLAYPRLMFFKNERLIAILAISPSARKNVSMLICQHGFDYMQESLLDKTHWGLDGESLTPVYVAPKNWIAFK